MQVVKSMAVVDIRKVGIPYESNAIREEHAIGEGNECEVDNHCEWPDLPIRDHCDS